MKWIPSEKEEYPVHYAEDRMHSFVMWAERHTLDERCEEVRAMRYIVDHEVVVRKIIALIHWSLVYGSLKLRNPVPQQVVGLEAINRDMQAPPNALFPIWFAPQHDLRSRAQTEWENIASWVQYWFDALQMEARPDMFFGGDARLISPLVYFIFHHVNRVLELPMRMKEILGNTGWAQIREDLEKFDDGKLNEKLIQEETEVRAVTNQNKWTDTTMELTARHNSELIQIRVREACKCRAATLHHQQTQDEGERRRWEDMKWFEREQRQREQEERDRERGQSKSRKHRETDLEWDRCHRRSDKEHHSQVLAAKARAGPLPPRVPPNEKMLTVKMPQSAGLAKPQPPHHQPPPSEGNSSPEQPTPPSSAPASSDAQMLGTSPTKMSQDAGELDEMEGDMDPLAEMRMHYIPDQSVPSALTEPAAKEAYDPCHIENMEADYKGQHSS